MAEGGKTHGTVQRPTSVTLAVPSADGGITPDRPAANPRLQALALYYRALEIEQDGGPNDECVALLRQALGLAPGFVPARAALARLESR